MDLGWKSVVDFEAHPWGRLSTRSYRLLELIGGADDDYGPDAASLLHEVDYPSACGPGAFDAALKPLLEGELVYVLADGGFRATAEAAEALGWHRLRCAEGHLRLGARRPRARLSALAS